MLNTQSLRTKILDLAMRGQLTEQLPTDGTAEDLYQRIQAEKQAMIKAGKIKKEKSLPPIGEDEIPFEVPKGWKWCRWGDVINIVSARRVHQSDWRQSGVPFYRAREIAKLSEDGFVNNELFISEELYAEFSKSGVPHENDLMVSAVGTLGKTYVVKSNDRFYYKDASVLCFENHWKINPFFLSYLMKSNFMRLQIECNSGGTTVDTLTMIRMIKYLIPLPPLAEQQRIVSRIEAAFAELDVIDKLQAAYHKNREVLRKKLIDAAIHGELTQRLPGDGDAEDLYQMIQAEKQAMIKAGKIKKEKPLPPIGEDEIPFEVPKGWKWCRLGEICKSITDGDHQPPPQTTEGVPFLVISNVSKGTLDFSNTRFVSNEYYKSLSKDRIANCGDVLFTVTGSYGIPIVVKTNKPFCFQRHIALLKPLIECNYLYFMLKCTNVKIQCDAVATGTAQMTVGLNSLRNMIVPLPPLAEQQRIVVRLGELLGTLG